MGEAALPLILSDLRQNVDEPDYWFVALSAITGENPVSETAYGNMVRMADAWLRFAEENGW